MVINACRTNKKTDSNQNVSHETCKSGSLFNNLIWLTTKEAALFLRMSISKYEENGKEYWKVYAHSRSVHSRTKRVQKYNYKAERESKSQRYIKKVKNLDNKIGGWKKMATMDIYVRLAGVDADCLTLIPSKNDYSENLVCLKSFQDYQGGV